MIAKESSPRPQYSINLSHGMHLIAACLVNMLQHANRKNQIERIVRKGDITRVFNLSLLTVHILQSGQIFPPRIDCVPAISVRYHVRKATVPKVVGEPPVATSPIEDSQPFVWNSLNIFKKPFVLAQPCQAGKMIECLAYLWVFQQVPIKSDRVLDTH